MWAAKEGHIHVVKILLEAGADVKKQQKVNECIRDTVLQDMYLQRCVKLCPYLCNRMDIQLLSWHQ